ncbi:MAG: alpha-glucosidase, partial [Microcoleus sp. SIO2G3]|nr:alpha-glucosidase [Microcoleus sp. SIO2G3]
MSFFNQAFQKLRLIKLQRFFGSLIYPVERDWLEWQARRSQTLQAVEKTGRINEVTPITSGGRFPFGHLEVEVHFLASDLVQVDWKPGIAPVPYAIAKQNWTEVET